MACDRFTRELKEHALGAPLGATAAAHLAVCSACQELFARENRLTAIIDTAIEQVGSVRPAADYQARLRESTDIPNRSMRGRWYFAAAAVSAAALLVVVARLQQGSGPTVDVRPSLAAVKDATKSPAAVETTNRMGATGLPVRPRSAHPRVHATSRAEELNVVVPAGQPEVIARLVASLRAQEPDVASQMLGGAVARAGMTSSAEAPVSVAPILIKSVDVPELLVLEPIRAN